MLITPGSSISSELDWSPLPKKEVPPVSKLSKSCLASYRHISSTVMLQEKEQTDSVAPSPPPALPNDAIRLARQTKQQTRQLVRSIASLLKE